MFFNIEGRHKFPFFSNFWFPKTKPLSSSNLRIYEWMSYASREIQIGCMLRPNRPVEVLYKHLAEIKASPRESNLPARFHFAVESSILSFNPNPYPSNQFRHPDNRSHRIFVIDLWVYIRIYCPEPLLVWLRTYRARLFHSDVNVKKISTWDSDI